MLRAQLESPLVVHLCLRCVSRQCSKVVQGTCMAWIQPGKFEILKHDCSKLLSWAQFAGPTLPLPQVWRDQNETLNSLVNGMSMSSF